MDTDWVSGLRNFELLADGSDRVFFDFPVAGYAGDLAAIRVQPDGMRPALAIENATFLAEVAVQVRQLHASASSIVSRNASGERFFSAISR